MKQGFALAQWLIACSIMVLLSMLTYRLMARWHEQVTALHERCDRLLPLHLALDMLQKDIAQADRIELTTDTCSLYAPYYQIHWYVRDNNLMRRAHTYNPEQQRWKKPATSLLAQHIDTITCKPRYGKKRAYGEHVHGVHIRITQGSTTAEHIGYLRNGNYKPNS